MIGLFKKQREPNAELVGKGGINLARVGKVCEYYGNIMYEERIIEEKLLQDQEDVSEGPHNCC